MSNYRRQRQKEKKRSAGMWERLDKTNSFGHQDKTPLMAISNIRRKKMTVS